METVPERDTVVELNVGHGAVGVGPEDTAVPVVVEIVPVPVPVPLGMVVELDTGHGGTKTPDVDVAGSADRLVPVQLALALAESVELGNGERIGPVPDMTCDEVKVLFQGEVDEGSGSSVMEAMVPLGQIMELEFAGKGGTAVGLVEKTDAVFGTVEMRIVPSVEMVIVELGNGKGTFVSVGDAEPDGKPETLDGTTVTGPVVEPWMVDVADRLVEFEARVVVPDVHAGGIGMSDMDVKFSEVVDKATPEDVGEAMADEFQVDHGDSTGCVKVGPTGNDVLNSELGKIDVPGAVPVAVTDELDAVNGGTRVADFEPDSVEEVVAVLLLLAEEPTDVADEIEELTAGDGARVVVFHVPLELELELVDVSETVARVPDSVSVLVGDEIAPDDLLDDEESPEEADVGG
ncbi:hypothetical protein CGCSCA5_v008762 [Colletotrichum siamense]|nr:hypothetical protein CGCSCA5_v008762 [Colletotrichum siamense]